MTASVISTITAGGQVLAIFNTRGGAELLTGGPAINSAGDGASLRPLLSPGSWFTVRGSSLAAVTRTWAGDDFSGNRLPTSLSGTAVAINGRPAYIAYVSPEQINALAPGDLSEGPATIDVTAPTGTARFSTRVRAQAPSLFAFEPENRRYAAAIHPDGTLAGKPGLFGGGAVMRPLVTGGRGVLYGTGFGRTDPQSAEGEAFSGANPIVGAENVRLSIGGRPASIEFAGAISPGLYQINFICPELFRGDHAVEIEFGGEQSQANLFLTIDGPEPPAPAARLGISPASLSFTATQSGTSPAAQILTVLFTPSSAIPWTAIATTESGGAWLRLSAAAGTGNGPISVSVSQAGLAPGVYRGRIAVSANAGDSPQSVAVTLTVQTPPSTAPILLSRDSLAFDSTIGAAAPASQQIQVSASGPSVEFAVEVSQPEAPWLRVTSSSKTTPAAVTFEINTRGITQGRYARHVRLRGTGGQIATVHVVFTILFPGDGVFDTATSIRTDETSLGGSTGRQWEPLNVIVSHIGGRVPFSVQVTRYTPGPIWLDATPATGSTPGSLRVSRDTRGLALGVHDALIRVFNDRSQSEIPIQHIIRSTSP